MASGAREQDYSRADEEGGEPAAAVDVFMEEELGADRVGDKGERGRGRSHQAQVGPRESDQIAEERQGHEEDAAKERSAGEHAGQNRQEAVLAAQIAEVADAAHGQGDEDISGSREDDRAGDAAPGVEDSHGWL